MRNIQPASVGGGYDLNYWKGRSDGQDRYHIAGNIGVDVSTHSPVEDTLYAFPYYASRGGTIDRIACYITAAGNTVNIRLGIYNNVSGYNPYPQNLLVDAGLVVGAGTGLQFINPGPLVLSQTLYWLCFNTEYVLPATYRAMRARTQFPVFGYQLAAPAGGVVAHWCVTSARAFGAHPAAFPAGGTFVTGVAANYELIAIGVRYSA